ncbi:MAG: hypothetical protein WDZ54_09960 [Sneathiella sp.]
MNAYEHLRDTALSMLVRDIPEEFWSDLHALGKIVYADTFAEVENDPSVVADQKIDLLLQRRHFRMEKLLVDLAARHGLSSSMSLILQNGRCHAYVFKGDVSMTQSYVKCIGDLPQPAKFRERLANTMELPRLDLGDEPDGAFIMPKLYGLVAHNPLGRRFVENDQKLGMIQFCLPSVDCKAWAVELSLTEISSVYPSTPSKAKPSRSLSWKARDADKGLGESK